MSTEEDNKLVEKYLAGDDSSLRKLIDKYLKPVYNFLYRLAGDKNVADDLAQDTFFKAWKNIKKFDADKSFKTWIFTIAKNTVYDYFRKKKTIPFSNFIDEEGNNYLENISEGSILPDEILDQKNIAQELDRKLSQVPEKYRTILLLHYKEDFSLQEIAEILKEPYNTIKSRHQRALAKLKEVLV